MLRDDNDFGMFLHLIRHLVLPLAYREAAKSILHNRYVIQQTLSTAHRGQVTPTRRLPRQCSRAQPIATRANPTARNATTNRTLPTRWCAWPASAVFSTSTTSGPILNAPSVGIICLACSTASARKDFAEPFLCFVAILQWRSVRGPAASGR